MGTLQQELAKVQNLDNLAFDDEPDAQQITMEEAPAKSLRERVWDWVRLHPMSSNAEITEGLGISPLDAARVMVALYNASSVTRQRVNGAYHYTTATDTYPRKDYGAALKKAWETRAQMAASGELKQRYALGKASTIPPAVEDQPKRKYTKRKLVARQELQDAPSPMLQAVPSYDPSVVSTWPVSVARAFYDELKKYFGG